MKADERKLNEARALNPKGCYLLPRSSTSTQPKGLLPAASKQHNGRNNRTTDQTVGHRIQRAPTSGPLNGCPFSQHFSKPQLKSINPKGLARTGPQTCTRMHRHTRAHMRTRRHMYTSTSTHNAPPHRITHVITRTYLRRHIHVYTGAHVHTHTHNAYTYAHTRTNPTPTRSNNF